MTANTTSDPAPDPEQREVLGLCVHATLPQLRRREDHLGQLCADGTIEVLDGALIHRPAAVVKFRPLQNLPRTAALPETLWARLCNRLARADPHDTEHSDAAACTQECSSDLVRVNGCSLLSVYRALVILTEPIPAGESALVAFLDAQALLDHRDLFHDITTGVPSRPHTGPTGRAHPSCVPSADHNLLERSASGAASPRNGRRPIVTDQHFEQTRPPTSTPSTSTPSTSPAINTKEQP